MSRMLGRVPWRRVLWAMIGANLVLLGLAVWRFRQEQAVYRLLQQRTLEAYSEAVRRVGPIRDRLLVNLGNLYFEQARLEGQPGAARAALASYREALRLNPELMAAKKNFEVAQRFLDALVPPREPREPRPPGRVRSSQMPLKPNDI
ncbi:MAG: hypothetical protein GTO22_05485 [Gemmatimonadales bacterium]|nr:hypothetical protein [Gemmatimonadales bacterium]